MQRVRCRPTLSCTKCKLRKLKCNRQTPCSQCIKSKSPHACHYLPTSADRPANPAPKPTATWAVRPSLPTSSASKHTTPSVPVNDITRGGSPAFVSAVSHQYSSRSLSPARPTQDHVIEDLQSRIRKLENDLHSCRRDAMANRVAFLGPLCFHGSNGNTRFFGRSHWAATLEFFDDITTFLNEYRKTKPEGGFEYRSMKMLKRKIYRREKEKNLMDCHLQAFRLCELVPHRKLADRFVQLYLSTFETTFRVLHVPQFLEEYKSFWDTSQKPISDSLSRNLFTAKLLSLMLCVSCLDHDGRTTDPGSGESLAQIAQGWMYGVRSWISSACGYSLWGVDLMQIKCLLLIARQAIAFDGDLVWISSGALVREGMIMGLHRDPSHFRKVSPYAGEVRRRLWTTIVELDVQASLDNGTPPTVDLDDFDCNLPSNIEDEEFSKQNSPILPEGSSERYTRTSFQVALARSLPTRLRIAKLVNSTKFNLSYNNALKLSEELIQILQCVPAELFIDRDPILDCNPQHRYTAFQVSLFRFLTYRFLTALHRPFALSASETRSHNFEYSRKVCFESSFALLSQIPASSLTSEHENGQYPQLLHLRGGMFRDDLFHAALTICLELLMQAGEMRLPVLPHMSSSVPLEYNHAYPERNAISKTVENLLDHIAYKVRVEKQACRAYITISMALASVKSRLSSPPFPAKDLGQDFMNPNRNAEHVSAVGRAFEVATRRCKELLLHGQNPGLLTQGQTDGEAEPEQDSSTDSGHRVEPMYMAALSTPPEENTTLSGLYRGFDSTTQCLPIGAADWNGDRSIISQGVLQSDIDLLFEPHSNLDTDLCWLWNTC